MSLFVPRKVTCAPQRRSVTDILVDLPDALRAGRPNPHRLRGRRILVVRVRRSADLGGEILGK
eukprot:5092782-Prymnesium_polylepis.1